MRAAWLGSAGLTALIRCLCGARLYLSVPHWSSRNFAVCDDCKGAIHYASLQVIAPEAVEDFVEMIINRQAEREALRGELERELRRFVRLFDRQPEWLWSPATVTFVKAVRPKLEQLGGEIWPGRRTDAATPEQAPGAEQ
ncbi:MAG: zinc ribbon domain-containing protein [Acidobacteria bacterium]|nr:zinc ribbon domain-containing protein [Acidobacteriota bacterium]